MRVVRVSREWHADWVSDTRQDRQASLQGNPLGAFLRYVGQCEHAPDARLGKARRISEARRVGQGECVYGAGKRKRVDAPAGL